jgi:hypothetical protein
VVMSAVVVLTSPGYWMRLPPTVRRMHLVSAFFDRNRKRRIGRPILLAVAWIQSAALGLERSCSYSKEAPVILVAYRDSWCGAWR